MLAGGAWVCVLHAKYKINVCGVQKNCILAFQFIVQYTSYVKYQLQLSVSVGVDVVV